MRRRGKVLTESQIRYQKRKAILEMKIDQMVREELEEALGQKAKKGLLGAAAAAGLLYGLSQTPSDADYMKMDHLMTIKQGIEMEYNKPIDQIPPSMAQEFYDECERLGIDPEEVR